MKTIFDPNPGCGVGRPIGGGRIVTELPDLAAGSDEVVLPRAHAQVLAVPLGDLLGREGGRR